jgi:UDP-glucuronate 4-epimerase
VRTVLVTGAAGFLGSRVAESLLLRGERVRGLDNLDPTYDPAVKRRNLEEVRRSGDLPLVEGDLRDPAAVRRALEGCDAVVHLAARAGVRASLADPVGHADVNVRGTAVLLGEALAAGIRTFVAASSSSVYGNGSRRPFAEGDPPGAPLSPYAATKRAMELLCAERQRASGIDLCCLRFFTVYGPRQRPEMAIHAFARALLAGTPLPLFGDGTSRRDYTYVDDAASAALAALDRARGFSILNVAGGRTVALADLVAALEAAFGARAILDRLPARAGDVEATEADVSRARAALGWEPLVPLEEGLARFAAWMRARA